MSTSRAILHQPTFRFLFSSSADSKYLRPTIFPSVFGSKSRVLGCLATRNVGIGEKKIWGSKAMDELMKASAYSDGNKDERISVFEQEALIGAGPSEIVSEGFESTLNRLSKWLVTALFAVVILWRHDAEALWAAMGSVVNTILSVVLKRILKQERPATALKSGPGMPSSHAQSIFFSVIFVIVSIVEWLGITAITAIISIFALTIGSYLSWLRISQRYHSISQVVIGAAVGSIFSGLWFWWWKVFVLEAFISLLWVKIVVIFGAICSCLGFLLYVYTHWLKDEH